MEKTETDQKRGSYHHGDLRAQLIEATRRLVESKGPDHFSVSEACREAGVSTAAPYKHFKNKGEMLREVAKGGMQRQHSQMMAELEPHTPGSIDRIVALGRVYTRFAAAEPGVFRLMFGLSEDHDEHEELVQMGDQIFSDVQKEVAKCFDRDEVTESDVNKAFLLWSFVHGLSFLQIDGKLTKTDMVIDHEKVLAEIAHRVMNEPGS